MYVHVQVHYHVLGTTCYSRILLSFSDYHFTITLCIICNQVIYSGIYIYLEILHVALWSYCVYCPFSLFLSNSISIVIFLRNVFIIIVVVIIIVIASVQIKLFNVFNYFYKYWQCLLIVLGC